MKAQSLPWITSFVVNNTAMACVTSSCTAAACYLRIRASEQGPHECVEERDDAENGNDCDVAH